MDILDWSWEIRGGSIRRAGHPFHLIQLWWGKAFIASCWTYTSLLCLLRLLLLSCFVFFSLPALVPSTSIYSHSWSSIAVISFNTFFRTFFPLHLSISRAASFSIQCMTRPLSSYPIRDARYLILPKYPNNNLNPNQTKWPVCFFSNAKVLVLYVCEPIFYFP